MRVKIIDRNEHHFVDRMSKAVTGDYVQFIEPGIRLRHDKLIRQVSAFEKTVKCRLSVVIAAGTDEMAKQLHIYRDTDGALPLVVYGVDQLQSLVYIENGCPFYGGLSSALFRRSEVESLGWFEDASDGNRVSHLRAWKMFFSSDRSRDIGIGAAQLVEIKKSAQLELDGILRWQAERCAILAEQKAVEKINGNAIKAMEEQLQRIVGLAELNGASKRLIDKLLDAWQQIKN